MFIMMGDAALHDRWPSRLESPGTSHQPLNDACDMIIRDEARADPAWLSAPTLTHSDPP